MKLSIKFVILWLTCATFSTYAQQNEQILIKIGNSTVSKEEFERIYHKNNTGDENTDQQKALAEYLKMFIDFKLKVVEAEQLGYDTMVAFVNELEGYRKALTKPYLNDESMLDTLVKEAYARMQKELKLSHLSIKLDPYASPKDTLAAWNKLMEGRKRVLAGEKFDAIAQNLWVDNKDNVTGGEIGYSTVFRLIYPFENAAYKTKVGDVSLPFRSDFGYHILKVHDIRMAQGQVKVAHIMVVDSSEIQGKAKIFEILKQARNGFPFDSLAKMYSDDKGTSQFGGELPWFGTGRMIFEFEIAAFSLKNAGDISEPVRTIAGWHIIKLVDKQPIPVFEQAKEDIKKQIQQDNSRSDITRLAVIRKVIKKYGYKETGNISKFYSIVDTSLFSANWKLEKAAALNAPLFTIGSTTYTEQDFAKYIAVGQQPRNPLTIEPFLDKLFKEFKEKMILKYEEARLEQNYPEYKYLLKEYHDGILLFTVSDEMVWTKAMKDTTGLEKFYETNKNNYMWDTRLDVSVYSFNNPQTAVKLQKLLASKSSKKLTDVDILAKMNKKTNIVWLVENGLFSKGDKTDIDPLFDLSATQNSKTIEGENLLQFVNKKVDPMLKTLSEAKGLITADYQTYLEKEWIKELHGKYKVEIDEAVLKTVK